MQFIKEYLRMIIIRAVNFFPLSEGKNNGCTCLLLLIAIWIQSLLPLWIVFLIGSGSHMFAFFSFYS